jgi:hypothetical protein
MPGGRAVSSSVLGDPVIDLKYQFLRKKEQLGASLALRSSLPVAGEESIIGSATPIIEAELALDQDFESFFVAVNLGHRQKADAEFENTVVGSEFFFRGGVAVPVTDNCSIGLEYGNRNTYQQDANDGSEIFLNTQGDVAGFKLRAGMGFGFGQAIGIPAWRAIAGVSYSPSRKAKDTDGDGIIDTQDQCVTEAEDMDSVQDTDGCPDPTAVTINFIGADGSKVENVAWTAGELNGTSGTVVESQAAILTLTATVDGYKPVSKEINIPDRADFTLDIPLEALIGSLKVNVMDEAGNPITQAHWVSDNDSTKQKNGYRGLPRLGRA